MKGTRRASVALVVGMATLVWAWVGSEEAARAQQERGVAAGRNEAFLREKERIAREWLDRAEANPEARCG